MKFAVLALAGSIGMGISTLASSLHRNNDDESQFYAGAGFFVMLVGTFAIIYPPLLDWWTKRKQDKNQSESALENKS